MTARRLLLIDDEPDFGAFVGRVARGLGYEVELTTRAAEFQEAYARFAPTHVIVDIVMPDKDGIEIVGWLAAMGCAAHVFIISGYNPGYAKAAKDLGALRGLRSLTTLKKPVSLADLRAALDAR